MTTYLSLTGLRRPLAHVGQPTQLMPVVVPAEAPVPAVDVLDLDLGWTAADLLLLPVALVLAGQRYRGTHRRDRHSVRRRGIWLSPTTDNTGWTGGTTR